VLLVRDRPSLAEIGAVGQRQALFGLGDQSLYPGASHGLGPRQQFIAQPGLPPIAAIPFLHISRQNDGDVG